LLFLIAFKPFFESRVREPFLLKQRQDDNNSTKAPKRILLDRGERKTADFNFLEAVKELFLEIVMMPFLFRRGEFCSGYVERISKKFNEV
jgi:hypothetical protein